MENRSDQPNAGESQAAVALTVAWMLTCMSTAVGVLAVLALELLMLAFPAAGGALHPLARMAGVFLFVALATGVLCLVFTPLAIKVRGTPPPRAVVVGAVLIGLSPFVLFVLIAVFQRR